MILIEASISTKVIGKYLSDDEYLDLQYFLLSYPNVGKVESGA